MAYRLRNRIERNYVGWNFASSDSENSYESDFCDDPDYSKIQCRRQTRRGNAIQHNNDNPDVEMADANGAASSRQRRRPGRPPRRCTTATTSTTATRRENQGIQITQNCIRRKRKKRRRASLPLIMKRTGRKQQAPTRAYMEKKTILSWLIDLNIIEDNAEVCYMDPVSPERVLLGGKATRSGIQCNCCGREMTVSDFEFHTRSTVNRPYQFIVLANNGDSLLEYQKEAWNRNVEEKKIGFNNVEPIMSATDMNDDACIFCADGGDLVCCEQCPSTIHSNCMDMERIPQGDWLCSYCICSHCKQSGNQEMSKCSLCNKIYHWACYTHEEINLNSSCTEFCGQSCEKIYEKLGRLVNVKNELDEGFSWTLLRHGDINSREPCQNLYEKIECNSKLSVAWNLLDQSFETIIDRHTKIDVVRSVVYGCGSNLNRVNFKGFCTAVLEKNDEVLCAATIRIHGRKLAEMPFVATQKAYRGKGMLKKLLVAIESALCYMNVENLVIPSAEDAKEMWINRFQFSHLKRPMKKEILLYNTLMFPSAIRLQKTLLGNASDLEVEDMVVDFPNNDESSVQYSDSYIEQPDVSTAGMEIDEVENNLVDGKIQEISSKRQPLFDLNLEPPPEED
ncbi:increased DNA methylation 1 [Ziziphus jujuba]|uniref:Increased DNA methylation 1 n=1 Tax=Ziziphus jujuba TaxID=326968 RepID=A0ABM3I4G6_ZIZJJ|nr:increased DNA methylation 1 [Ziziphus jujuba]